MTKTYFPAGLLLIVLCVLYAGSCVEDRGAYTAELPEHKVASSSDGVIVRVLIPAGSSANQHVRGGQNEPVPIEFLPYPGNLAELVSPAENSTRVMVLTDALAKGSTLQVKPVAVLQLDSAGVQRDIIIAVPTDTLLMSLRIGGFADLITDYEPVRYILQTWFVNYRGFGAFEVVGWRDEAYAHKLLTATNR